MIRATVPALGGVRGEGSPMFRAAVLWCYTQYHVEAQIASTTSLTLTLPLCLALGPAGTQIAAVALL